MFLGSQMKVRRNLMKRDVYYYLFYMVEFAYTHPYFSIEDLQSNDRFIEKNFELTQNLLQDHTLLSFFGDRVAWAKEYYWDIPYHNTAHHLTVTNFAILISKVSVKKWINSKLNCLQGLGMRCLICWRSYKEMIWDKRGFIVYLLWNYQKKSHELIYHW